MASALPSMASSMNAARNTQEVSLRNIVSTIMKDINNEVELLAKVLPDIEAPERRRRLLFWAERSRHHIENLSRLCQWIMKYQPTLDAIDQMYKRIKTQRNLVEKSFSGCESIHNEGWQQWSRAPDVPSSISVLRCGGSFPFLPTNIFTIGEKQSNVDEETSEHEQLRYERVVQRQLISEKVPSGGRLVCSIGGLVELSSPSFFVAFLVLKTGNTFAASTTSDNAATSLPSSASSSGHVWEVKGVEVLVNGVLDFNRVGCPSEKDLQKITACANGVAYQSNQGSAIERIYSCISVLVSSVAMRMLETQAVTLVKSKHMGIIQAEMDTKQHLLTVQLWAPSPSFSTTASSSAMKRSILEHQHGTPVIEIRGQSVEAAQSSMSSSSVSQKHHLSSGTAPLSAVLSFGVDHTKFKLKIDPKSIDLAGLLLQAYQICIKARLEAIRCLCQNTYDSLVNKLWVPQGSMTIIPHALDGVTSDQGGGGKRTGITELACVKLELRVCNQCCCVIGIDVRSGALKTFLSPSLASQYYSIQAKLSSLLQSLCLVHQLSPSFSSTMVTSSSSSTTNPLASHSSFRHHHSLLGKPHSNQQVLNLKSLSESFLDMIRIGHIQFISSRLLAWFPSSTMHELPHLNYDEKSIELMNVAVDATSPVYQIYNCPNFPDYLLNPQDNKIEFNKHFLLEVSFEKNVKPIYSLVYALQRKSTVGGSKAPTGKVSTVSVVHKLILPNSEICMPYLTSCHKQPKRNRDHLSRDGGKSEDKNLLMGCRNQWNVSKIENGLLHAYRLSCRIVPFLVVSCFLDDMASPYLTNKMLENTKAQALCNGGEDGVLNSDTTATGKDLKLVSQTWLTALTSLVGDLDYMDQIEMQLPSFFYLHTKSIQTVIMKETSMSGSCDSNDKLTTIHWSFILNQDFSHITSDNVLKSTKERTVRLLHHGGTVKYVSSYVQNNSMTAGIEQMEPMMILDIILSNVPLVHGTRILLDHIFIHLDRDIQQADEDEMLTTLNEKTQSYVNASLL